MKFHLKYLLQNLAFCLIVLLVCVVSEIQFHPVGKLLDNFLYDNQNHYLSCNQLPTVTQAKSVMAEHQDIVKKIEDVDRDYIRIFVDDITCPEKADVFIEYPSHVDRIRIQEIINSDTFFGIPYRLHNY